MFRDSAAYLPRYFMQVAQLREIFDVRCVWAFGDCTDDTGTVLYRESHPGDTVVQVDHGGLAYGSIDNETRWLQIANVFRALVGFVPEDVPFVWVESDLIWKPDAIWALLYAVTRFPFDVVCPMVFHEGSDRFYDTWGYRRHGQMFYAQPPYTEDVPGVMRYVMLDSCGSCFAARPESISRVKEWGGHWPLKLPHIWLDSAAAIYHPELRG